MARDHARIMLSVWRDADFRSLTLDAQGIYFTAISQPTLTYAGVLDYRPKRLAALSSGTTPRRVENALKVLLEKRFVVIDDASEELLARSYVRHDGVMDRTNMGKAVGRAIDKIISLDLRESVLAELSRLYIEKPGLSGFGGLADINPDAMAHVEAMASTIPLPMASAMQSKVG